MPKLFKGVMLLSIVFVIIGAYSTQTKAQGADVKGGQAKFQQLCAVCHGAKGKGDGPAGAGLNPKPKDLSKTTKTDADLKTVITKGGAAAGLSPTMPPWGAMLSERDIANIIAYIRTLSPR